jgi:transposase
MSTSGTAEQLEKRRRRAIALLQAGTLYREAARRVDASLSSVVRWG